MGSRTESSSYKKCTVDKTVKANSSLRYELLVEQVHRETTASEIAFPASSKSSERVLVLLSRKLSLMLSLFSL
jgi:hypothetical protein